MGAEQLAIAWIDAITYPLAGIMGMGLLLFLIVTLSTKG